LAASLIAAPAGEGDVTIGSSLSASPTSGMGCLTTSCTLGQSALPGRVVSSPVNGTITVWRVRGPSAPTDFRLRVIKPLGGGALFKSSSAAGSLIAADDDTHQFPTSLPIATGDRIALDKLSVAGSFPTIAGGAAAVDFWDPAPANGATASPSPVPSTELLMNAEIVPTNVFTLGTPVPNPKDGSAVIDATLPNRGSVHGDPVLATRARKKKKRRRPQRLIAPFTAVSIGPGPITLRLKPTGTTLKKLSQKGKASGVVDFTYTPDFGVPFTQSTALTLTLQKPKKKRAKAFTVG
jgi:hypothetical protein